MSEAAPIADVVAQALLYGVMPLWLAASFADWWCHRRSRIERTSGWRESALHALMIAELGIPVLAATFFQTSAQVVAVMLAAFALHEFTVYVDLRYASARRDIPPVEQIVHSFMELVPLTAMVLVVLLDWPAALALDAGLRLREPPVPAPVLVAMGAAILLLIVIPYAEELWRCARSAAASAPASRAR